MEIQYSITVFAWAELGGTLTMLMLLKQLWYNVANVDQLRCVGMFTHGISCGRLCTAAALTNDAATHAKYPLDTSSSHSS